jgi:hypothetical protein
MRLPGVEPPFRAAYFPRRLQSRCRAEARLYKKRGWMWSGSGANPRHLDGQTESILFLTNMSGQRGEPPKACSGAEGATARFPAL